MWTIFMYMAEQTNAEALSISRFHKKKIFLICSQNPAAVQLNAHVEHGRTSSKIFCWIQCRSKRYKVSELIYLARVLFDSNQSILRSNIYQLKCTFIYLTQTDVPLLIFIDYFKCIQDLEYIRNRNIQWKIMLCNCFKNYHSLNINVQFRSEKNMYTIHVFFSLV